MSEAQSEAVKLQAQWLAAAFGDALAEAIEFTSGERPRVVECEAPMSLDASNGESPVSWCEQTTDLSDDAVIWIGSPRDTWTELGRRGLKTAGVAEAGEDEIRGTYNELLQQSLSLVAQKIGKRLGREVSCLEATPEAAVPEVSAVGLHLQYGDGEQIQIYAAFSPALIESLSADDCSPDADLESESRHDVVDDVGQSKTIELLLDVELPVSVSFGRTHLPLKDVLKLTSGSIVELNRAVSEPVEVIVNNCVIARGEVVVVDGNYGVRIYQIISRRERLRTLN
jgi:flagellar motor switch protein FliN/FliY